MKSIAGPRPEWAQAAIVARRVINQSDPMTDYFGTKEVSEVIIGWSKHKRDLFPEMRKAAATFGPTSHLAHDTFRARVIIATVTGGEGLWPNFYAGQFAPWYEEMERVFSSKAEADAYTAATQLPGKSTDYTRGQVMTFGWQITRTSVEHREKWSMGHGYYLKASGRYSSGWEVAKTWWCLENENVQAVDPAEFLAGSMVAEMREEVMA